MISNFVNIAALVEIEVDVRILIAVGVFLLILLLAFIVASAKVCYSWGRRKG